MSLSREDKKYQRFERKLRERVKLLERQGKLTPENYLRTLLRTLNQFGLSWEGYSRWKLNRSATTAAANVTHSPNRLRSTLIGLGLAGAGLFTGFHAGRAYEQAKLITNVARYGGLAALGTLGVGLGLLGLKALNKKKEN